MTDIDNMPAGPEMDRLIAEMVMGWTVGDLYSGEDRAECPGLTLPHYYDPDGTLGLWAVGSFRPSTRIAHAWEVVEKMTTGGRVVRLNTDEHGTMCRIIGASGDGIASNLAESAPLAICRAALKAIGAQ